MDEIKLNAMLAEMHRAHVMLLQRCVDLAADLAYRDQHIKELQAKLVEQ